MMAEIQKNELTVIGMKQGVLVRRAEQISDIVQQTTSEQERLRNEILITKRNIESHKTEINQYVSNIAAYEREEASLEAQRKVMKAEHGSLD